MLLLDRYLLRQFLQVFVICFLSFTGLWIVIDAFGNLEEFLSYSSKQGVGLLQLVGGYYGYRSLTFFDRTSGILTLIAAMFTLAWFQRYNEMTAAMAAGIPKWRIIKPIVIAVGIIAVAAAANRELVIPSIRDKISGNAQDLGGESGKRLEPRFDKLTDIFLRGRLTFANQQRIQEPAFRLPPTLDRYGNQLAAENAYYRPPQDDRPGGYLFQNVKAPRDLAKKPSLSLNGQKVILTPLDTPWLEPEQCFVASEVDFEQLAGAAAWRQLSSTPELVTALHNPSLDFGADVRVAVHSRVVQPMLDLTLLFLGLPLVLGRENRNVFVAIGLCVAVVVAFLLVVLIFQYLGSSYLISPSLAAWCPLMIFVPLAVGMSEPLRQ
jgi:lipopolysaccharide export system permease protein